MIHKEYLVLFQSNIKLNLTVINNKQTINFKFA